MFKKVRNKMGLKCGHCEDSFLFVITKEMHVECAYCGHDKGKIENRKRHIQSKQNLLRLRGEHDVMHCAICWTEGGNDYIVEKSGPKQERSTVHCSSCGTMVNDIQEVSENGN